MGDPKDLIALLPGCGFYPSEEQLICHFLTHKNNTATDNDHSFGFDVIKEVDLYNYDPFDLPETACFRFGCGARKRHWYCYAVRVLKEGGRRRAGSGCWKSTSRVRDVVVGPGGKTVVGTRQSFVFYLRNSPKSAKKTHWVMYEYALADHLKASFVLCRVFAKPRRGNNTSEHVLSSCGEESVATVRHIGIQHDGIITSDIGDGKLHDDNPIARKNEILRFPVRLVHELDDQVTPGPLSVTGFQFPSGILPNEPVRTSRLAGGGAMFVDIVAAQQSILEEDFIELVDLLSPLSGG